MEKEKLILMALLGKTLEYAINLRDGTEDAMDRKLAEFVIQNATAGIEHIETMFTKAETTVKETDEDEEEEEDEWDW